MPGKPLPKTLPIKAPHSNYSPFSATMTPQPNQIRGLLIDMDGTLVDHLDTLARCFQHACAQLGFPEPSHELVLRTIGGSMPVTIQKFLPPEHVQAGIALWQQRFEEIHLEGVVVLPGAASLLDLCRNRAIKTAIFTNKTGRHTRAILAKEGLASKLDFALGAEDTPYRKPQPEYSAIAIERLGLPAANVAMVGDSPFDIQAGNAVGMVTLCVATGSHTADELAEAGADFVFPSLQAIADWLAKADAT